jgi:hypothetical protein
MALVELGRYDEAVVASREPILAHLSWPLGFARELQATEQVKSSQ